MEIYARLKKDGIEYSKIFSCWDLYYEYTFSPDIEVLEIQICGE